MQPGPHPGRSCRPDANRLPSPRTTIQIGRGYRGAPRTGEVSSPSSPRSGSRSSRTHGPGLLPSVMGPC